MQRNSTNRLERQILPCSRSESVTINLGASTFAFDIQVYLLAIYCTRSYSGLHLDMHYSVHPMHVIWRSSAAAVAKYNCVYLHSAIVSKSKVCSCVNTEYDHV